MDDSKIKENRQRFWAVIHAHHLAVAQRVLCPVGREEMNVLIAHINEAIMDDTVETNMEALESFFRHQYWILLRLYASVKRRQAVIKESDEWRILNEVLDTLETVSRNVQNTSTDTATMLQQQDSGARAFMSLSPSSSFSDKHPIPSFEHACESIKKKGRN